MASRTADQKRSSASAAGAGYPVDSVTRRSLTSARRGDAHFMKMLLGTMQWTPLRTSTIWLTRQSATSAASE